jgi:hypothetical protein
MAVSLGRDDVDGLPRIPRMENVRRIRLFVTHPTRPRPPAPVRTRTHVGNTKPVTIVTFDVWNIDAICPEPTNLLFWWVSSVLAKWRAAIREPDAQEHLAGVLMFFHKTVAFHGLVKSLLRA